MSLFQSLASSLASTNKALERTSWKREEAITEESILEVNGKALETNYENTIKALSVAQEVAQQTQKELEVQISFIVTSAIQAIFKKPYEFKVDFQVRRNKTEADLYMVDADGNRFNPLHDNGGGVADIIAFTLRIACWRLNNPRSSACLVYDEPLKFVSSEYLPAVANFVQEISSKLDLQIIMVTHVKEFIEAADNVIEIK